MTIAVLKMHFQKLAIKVFDYRDFKKIDNERFMNCLLYNLNEERTNYNKNPDKVLKIWDTYLILMHPKRKIIHMGITDLS